MGTASDKQPASKSAPLIDLTLRACEAARAAAAAVADGLTSEASKFLDEVRQREEELDHIDREINEGVTEAIASRFPSDDPRELLACLKYVMDLERIGDLLLGFANRARAVYGRMDMHDLKDLSTMAALLEKMLADSSHAFRRRDANLAVTVFRADMEIDRLRNLIFMRHIENPEGEPRQESFHVVFMTQALERAGDHAKNLAEEVVHLSTGHSVRHLLRQQDRPDEVRFLEHIRNRENKKQG
jgi:phosphate transport system protein